MQASKSPMKQAAVLGNTVDEEVGDVVLRQIALGELLIVHPRPLARDSRQPRPALVPECVLDVAHIQAARQKLHRHVFELLCAALQVLAGL